MNLDLPLFDFTPDELDTCLADLDRAVDAAFLGDLRQAMVRVAERTADPAAAPAKSASAA